MVTSFLYVFLFFTWGLGLLSWIVGLGNFLNRMELEVRERALDIEQKKLLLDKFKAFSTESTKPSTRNITVPREIPEKLRELMKSSPDHPEVEEIEPTDEIIGVKFEAADYPPGFGDSEDDEE